MENKDYLILAKGRAACLMLDTTIALLDEMIFSAPSAEDAKKECARAYDFLTEIGIAVPEDFNLEMSYVDSMLDVVPGEMKCN